MTPADRSRITRYGAAVLAALTAWLLRLALDPVLGDRLPFLAFALAVVAVAWHGGFGPAVLTLLLGLLAAAYFFLSPRHALADSLAAHNVQVIGFVFLGVTTGLFSEALRSARLRAEARRQELEQEVAERRRLEGELNQRVEELAEAARRKDEFLAMLSHELRNPLAPIRTAAHALKQLAPADPHLQRTAGVIERQVAQLARLVDDLLDVSRLTRGRITLQREVIDLGPVVARAVEAARPALDARRHQLAVDVPRLPVRVEGDVARLTQVLANLLDNAAKYTPPGGHVGIAVERTPTEAVVRVRDDGVGIPADLLPRVFDLFTQGDRSLARSDGGLGIGLTLVKRLTELHGGRVEVTSEGAGCEVLVRLPLARREGSLASGPSQPAPAGGRRVLAVDDNVDAVESLALVLGLSGYEVRTAYDGPTALAEAEAFRPEVVLLDIGMPVMDGYEVAQRLREKAATAAALLVALTGYGQEEDRVRSQEAGFDLHFVKPVEPTALHEVLALHLSGPSG